MSNTTNFKQFRVDPGMGKKYRNCPYSRYEDGHDIVDYIIPPRGYVFVDFKLVPDRDTNYDGRLIAQYEKKHSKQPILWGGIITVAVTGIILYFAVFSKPKSKTPVKDPKPVVENVMTDTVKSELMENNAQDTATVEPEIAQTAIAQNTEAQTNEAPKATTTPEAVEAPKPKETPKVEEKPKPAETTPTVQEQTTKPAETIKTESNDRGTQFKKEFWELIHRQETNMGTYHELYRKYKKDNLKSKEFYYLYLTILENTAGFNRWKADFLRVPSNEIKSINNINTLKQKLEEYK